MTIERRLAKLEAADVGGEHRIIYCRTERDAAAVYDRCFSDGTPAPLVVVDPDQGEAILAGPTIRELLDRIARGGRSIHDQTLRSREISRARVWRQAQAGAAA